VVLVLVLELTAPTAALSTSVEYAMTSKKVHAPVETPAVSLTSKWAVA